MSRAVFIFKALESEDTLDQSHAVRNYPKELPKQGTIILRDMDPDVCIPALYWLEERFWSGKREENPDKETACDFDDRSVVAATVNLAHYLGDVDAYNYAKERLVYMIATTEVEELPQWRPLLGISQDGDFKDDADVAKTELEHRFVHLGESPSQAWDAGGKWGLRTREEYEACVERARAAGLVLK